MGGCASACGRCASLRMSGSRLFNGGSSRLRRLCARQWRRCGLTPSDAGRGCGSDALFGPMRIMGFRSDRGGGLNIRDANCKVAEAAVSG